MTWTTRRNSKQRLLKAYDREMLRSAFASLFWVVITYRKEHGGFSLKALADRIGVNKSEPSRWFSGPRPNWTLNTVADLAGALGVDLEIRARDSSVGVIFAPYGTVETHVQSASPIIGEGPATSTSSTLAAIDRVADAAPLDLITVQ